MLGIYKKSGKGSALAKEEHNAISQLNHLVDQLKAGVRNGRPPLLVTGELPQSWRTQIRLFVEEKIGPSTLRFLRPSLLASGTNSFLFEHLGGHEGIGRSDTTMTIQQVNLIGQY